MDGIRSGFWMKILCLFVCLFVEDGKSGMLEMEMKVRNKRYIFVKMTLLGEMLGLWL